MQKEQANTPSGFARRPHETSRLVPLRCVTMAQARRSGTAFGTWPRSSPRVGWEARQKLDRARRARGEVVHDLVHRHRFSAQCLWYGRMVAEERRYRWRKSVAWAGPNRPKPTNEMYGREKPKATRKRRNRNAARHTGPIPDPRPDEPGDRRIIVQFCTVHVSTTLHR